MLIVAVAAAMAGQLHLGLSGEVATAIGVALFCLMLMSHVLLRAADEADLADEEAAERSVAQVSSPMPTVPLPRTAEDTPAAAEPAREPSAAVVEAGPPMHAEGLARAQTVEQLDAHLGAHFEGAVSSQKDPSWGFRPVDLRQPVTGGAETGGADNEVVARDAEGHSFGSLRPTYEAHHFDHVETHTANMLSVDREADRVDSILKRLAKQIQDGAAERSRTADPQLPGMEAVQEAGGVDAGRSTETPDLPAALEQAAAEHPDTALASAVDALRSTVEAMRGGPAALPTEPVLSAAEISVAAVAEAIQRESADVFLSPILGLADQSARHFEVSVKLRTDVPDERRVAAGAGLLPLLDALNVRHAAGFALMLERRGRDGAVFSRVDGGSLENESFLTDVAGRHAQGIANRMVLSFAQHEMRGLGPAQMTALEDLARLGFRFSMQAVADLDMDFEALKTIGFDFVKLDAAVFQAGLVCGGELVPAAEICEHLEDLGLSVIVGDIADEEMRDRLVGWGVAFGQGSLFGGPKPVPVATPATTMAA